MPDIPTVHDYAVATQLVGQALRIAEEKGRLGQMVSREIEAKLVAIEERDQAITERDDWEVKATQHANRAEEVERLWNNACTARDKLEREVVEVRRLNLLLQREFDKVVDINKTMSDQVRGRDKSIADLNVLVADRDETIVRLEQKVRDLESGDYDTDTDDDDVMLLNDDSPDTVVFIDRDSRA
jgi:hypothetical protein